MRDLSSAPKRRDQLVQTGQPGRLDQIVIEACLPRALAMLVSRVAADRDQQGLGETGDCA